MTLSVTLPNLSFYLMLGVCLFVAPARGQIEETRRVLAVSEVGISAPAVAAIVRDLDTSLQVDSAFHIEFYSEYLETALFSDEASQVEIRTSLIRKYQRRVPNLIIAVGPTPTRFMVEAHERFFPGIPIVFCCSSEQQADYPKLDAHFAGTWLDFDTDRTLDAAILLLPKTKHVVVVGGVSAFDRHLEDLVQQTERKHEVLQFTYLTNLPMETVFERVKRLPDNTIILFTSVSVDAGGKNYNPNPELVRTVAREANAPVFTLSDTLVGQGAVGGYVVRYLSQGKSIAAIVLKILHGTGPQEIGISKEPSTYMFDWSVLRRWRIKESDLPPGSIVINRQYNFWEMYGRYVLVGLSLVIAQTLLILALLAQRTKRKRSEQSLVWRLKFEGLLSDLSATFIGLPEEDVDANIERGLARIGEFLQMDRITLFEFSRDRTDLLPTSAWNAPGAKSTPPLLTASALPWWRAQVVRGEACLISRLDDMPEEASIETAYLRQRGIVSIASIPLKVGGEINGMIAFISERREVLWTQDLVKQLRVAGDIFWNAVKRKRAHEALLATQALVREREERFRFVANTAPVTIWMTDVDNNCTYANQHWLDFTGRSLDSQLGMGWTEQIHPEDLKRSWETLERALAERAPFQLESRTRRHDGEYRWMLASGVPRFNTDGSFAGYIGSAVDITERKLAEEALSTVSQKLIEAQEQERSRIARELHDDINQQLALLSVSLESLKQGVPDSAAQRIGETSERIVGVAKDIQTLSHRLHSSKLEYLGLAAAAKSFCREFSDQQKVEISFRSENIPKELPQEISVCLFRVLQEALQNATKHSGSRQFQVSLKNGTNHIELTVHDLGIGFDVREAIKGRGLGLTSMRERLKLVNGELSIDSQLQRGTMIRALVPLNIRTKSAGAVG